MRFRRKSDTLFVAVSKTLWLVVVDDSDPLVFGSQFLGDLASSVCATVVEDEDLVVLDLYSRTVYVIADIQPCTL